jgi:hypothetical protein
MLILRRRSRLAIYIFGFIAAIVIDIMTPLGVADWLFQLGLVWLASMWSDTREMRVFTAMTSATLLIGLWTSPTGYTPFWLCASNRVLAVGISWAMVQLVHQRRLAEQGQREAIAQVKLLEGLLPICASCKSIRTATGNWEQLEKYISDHSGAQFSHSLCPCCVPRYFPEQQSGAVRV